MAHPSDAPDASPAHGAPGRPHAPRDPYARPLPPPGDLAGRPGGHAGPDGTDTGAPPFAPLDPRSAPVPAYGTAALCDVIPAAVAGFRIPGMPATGLRLEPADRVCVFLVDGLGWELILRHPDEAPYLTSLLPTSTGGTGRPLTAGFPATTATSLASVGTGLPPGGHGLAGYTVRDPATGELMNQLRWQPWTAPEVWQPHPTVFRLADAAGIATCQVSSPDFQRTPLTQVALSGGTFLGRLTGEDRVDLAAARLAAGDRSLVYTYYSELDAMGHRHGVDSDAWRGQLMMVDRLAQRLAEQLPPRSALYVTADHGMIDVPFDEESRIDFDEDWELRAGVALLGGEARARHVYAVPGAASDVLAVWREVLGDRMWVAGRDEAVAAGWFGPDPEPRVLGRIGDVVAAARDDIGIVAGRREPNETRMTGLHGSMAPVDQLVPLLEVRS